MATKQKISEFKVMTANPELVRVLYRRVQKGRDALVKMFGINYVKKINPKKLFMDRAESCVLGQTFGDYSDGVRKMIGLGAEGAGSRRGDRWGVQHGVLVLNHTWYGDYGLYADPDLDQKSVGYDSTYIYGVLGDIWREQMKKDQAIARRVAKAKKER